MVEQTCQVKVNRGDGRMTIYQPCGRKIERDGKCKMHLRVEENRRIKEREWREKWDRSERLQAEAADLSRRLGIEVAADYSPFGKSGYTGRFIVPGDWLREHADQHSPKEAT